MSLSDFLREPKNFWITEAIINHRLCYELKLAAAFLNYNLIVSRPDIDLSGFDLVFDDGETQKKIQIKTVLSSSRTNDWKIRKLLLAPAQEKLNRLGIATIPPWIGLEGGFILAKVAVDSTKKGLDVSYSYADFFTIAMLSMGVFRDDCQQVSSDALFHLTAIGDDKIKITKKLLIAACSPMHLLALMGLRSSKIFNWPSDAIQLLRIHRELETCEKIVRHKEGMAHRIEDAFAGRT